MRRLKRKAERFQRLLQELREHCPPLLPVRVYRRDLAGEDCLAYTTLVQNPNGTPSHFRIVVHAGMSWDAMWQVMIHEWAHTVAWHEGHLTVEDHGPEWALALSRVYQEVVEP